jgi:cation diffusion facilitator family transporter
MPDMAEESRAAVLVAMGANVAIAAGKLVAGILTGSAAMLAEAGHSLADTMNEVFLLVGINLSHTKADEGHPHGYGKEGFFWAFLAAIFTFVAGATFSFYEGARTLIQSDVGHHSARDMVVAYAVLGMAFVFEASSWSVAVRQIVQNAREKGWSFKLYLRRSPNLTTKTVFWEDSAAVAGLVLAAFGLGLAEATGSERWDGAASLAIGVVLAAAAFLLGMQARSLLLGEAANTETRAAIRETLATFPEVTGVVRLLTMQLGTQSVLVNGELAIQRGLTTEEIEDLIARIDSRLAVVLPEISDTFWELRPRAEIPAEAPTTSEG